MIVSIPTTASEADRYAIGLKMSELDRGPLGKTPEYEIHAIWLNTNSTGTKYLRSVCCNYEIDIALEFKHQYE